MNLLVDTCVFIDFLGRKAPFFEEAVQVVAAGYFGDAKLWIAGQSINDAFFVLNRYMDSQKVQQAIAESLAVFTPVALSPQDYQRAAALGWKDLEDCLVALCAEKAKANWLVTRDARGFERSPVPAISPTEWLALKRADGFEYDQVELE